MNDPTPIEVIAKLEEQLGTVMAEATAKGDALVAAVNEANDLRQSVVSLDAALAESKATIIQLEATAADLTAKLTAEQAARTAAEQERDAIKARMALAPAAFDVIGQPAIPDGAPSEQESRGYAELHSEYMKISDPRERAAFRKRHAEALGIKINP